MIGNLFNFFLYQIQKAIHQSRVEGKYCRVMQKREAMQEYRVKQNSNKKAIIAVLEKK